MTKVACVGGGARRRRFRGAQIRPDGAHLIRRRKRFHLLRRGGRGQFRRREEACPRPGRKVHLDAPVARFGPLRLDQQLALPRAHARDRRGGDAFVEQEVADGVGAPLTEPLVELFVAARIRVSGDLDAAGRIRPKQALQRDRQDRKPPVVLLGQRRAVEGKAVQKFGCDEPCGQRRRSQRDVGERLAPQHRHARGGRHIRPPSRDGIARGPLGLCFRRSARIANPHSTGRDPIRLLKRVREFVRQQPLAGEGTRRVLPFPEHDVGAHRVRQRVHRSRRVCGPGIGMHAPISEIVTEARLRHGAGDRVDGLAGGRQHFVRDPWCRHFAPVAGTHPFRLQRPVLVVRRRLLAAGAQSYASADGRLGRCCPLKWPRSLCEGAHG